MTIAERIINYRAENKLTQRQMAELLGISINSLFNYESGRTKPISANKIRVERKMKELEEKSNV